jgi:hypothetical protein
MSPSKKKAAKSAAKKAGAKAKAAKAKPKKKVPAKKTKKAKKAKAAPKKATAKTRVKKAAKSTAKKSTKTPAHKAAVKKAASKSSAKAAAKSTAKPGAKKASKAAAPAAQTKAKTKGKAAKVPSKPGKRARPKKPITPTGPRHPKLGFRWICYACDAKFYDLGKEQPICPKCEADQHERPPADAKPSADTPKPKVVRPMAQLLDDEEPAVNRDEEARPKNAPQTEKEMFDDAESDADGLDVDDAETTNDVNEPPEIDAL